MKELDQNMAIVEFCGWKCHIPEGDAEDYGDCVHWKLGQNIVYVLSDLPSYTTDLNAMHEAEKLLTKQQIASYQFSLRYVTKEGMASDWNLINATAAQRAEALLRTIKKWKD
jgi:hypothetical protein